MSEPDSGAVQEQTKASVDMGEPKEWKKYAEYSVNVDPAQDDKATEIKLCSFARPHMRAFHFSWWGFFTAFFIWYALAPLMGEIQKSLGLTKKQVWTSNIVGVSGTIFMRFLLGPFNDKYGPRVLFAVVLCFASIPTALVGTVNSASGLYVLRLFIGVAGGTFVMCQYWTSRMFTKEVVGTANAMAGGWGNLGGGVTQLVMGSVLFPLFKLIYGGNSDEAWRTVCVVPAVVTFATGILLYSYSDDCPKGSYAQLKMHGSMPPVSAAASFRSGSMNLNSWLLFLQYGCCFGVELTMDAAAALYFSDKFGQSTASAAAIASIFGWMNIFARVLGGYISDKLNAKLGMRGRLCLQTVLLALEGVFALIFGKTNNLGVAIVIMVIFALFTEMACGSTYGIVPYVDPPNTGSISGIVGAGGNVGAVGFGLAFRQLPYETAFTVMGATIMGVSALSFLIKVKGHSALLWGTTDLPAVDKLGGTIVIPERDSATKEEVDD